MISLSPGFISADSRRRVLLKPNMSKPRAFAISKFSGEPTTIQLAIYNLQVSRGTYPLSNLSNRFSLLLGLPPASNRHPGHRRRHFFREQLERLDDLLVGHVPNV